MLLLVEIKFSSLRILKACSARTLLHFHLQLANCSSCSAGSSLNIIKRTVKYLCPADIIPPFIDVDLSELDVGEKIVAGNLNVHPALKLLRSKDEAVVKIMGARVSDQRKSK